MHPSWTPTLRYTLDPVILDPERSPFQKRTLNGGNFLLARSVAIMVAIADAPLASRCSPVWRRLAARAETVRAAGNNSANLAGRSMRGSTRGPLDEMR